MALQDIIIRYAQNEEERLIGRRLLDLYELTQRSGQKMYTGFLSKSEQAYGSLACSHAKINIGFWGGFEGAERSIAIIFPDDVEDLSEYEKEETIAAICVKHHEKLSHRDLLGAAIGLGVKRQMIGDILVAENESTLLVTRAMVPFFLSNYNKAGHVALSCSEMGLENIASIEPTYKIITDTIASNRLDSIVASGFSQSRELVKRAIMRELVNVNDRMVTSADAEVQEGDIISMRGQGKFILSSIGGKSKKGRIWIEIKRYV
jgi:RNA-binding protein YlmH